MAAEVSRRQFVTAGLAMGGMAACIGATGATQVRADEAKAQFAPGTYTATRQGMHGDVTVQVTLSADALESVEVTENDDTQMISTYAVDLVPEEIVRYQTLDVDSATGATMTSAAIFGAVQDCLDQAGATLSGEAKPEPTAVEHADEQVDVLVVGAGTAGIMAALSAATVDGQPDTANDLSVMVVEQLPYAGGSFIVSGAGMATLYGDPLHEAGEYTTVDEDMYVDYCKFRSNDDDLGCLNERLIRAQYQAIRPAEELMMAYGTRLSDDPIECVDPMAGEQFPDDAWLEMGYFDENGEKVEPNVMPIDQLVGTSFVGMLGRQPNVELRCCCEAVAVVVEDGAVTGVRVRETDQAANEAAEYVVSAKKVILTTGSPALNYDLLDEYGWDLGGSRRFCGAGSKGAGITMLRDAGLEPTLIGMGGMCYNGFSLEYGMEGGLSLRNVGCPVLNMEGKRFYDEGNTPQVDTGRETQKQTDNTAYCIVDSKPTNFLMGTEPGFYIGNDGMVLGEYAVERGWAVKADTLEELFAQLDVDADAALATMDAFNKAAAGEGTDELGGTPESMVSVTEAPFYAVIIHAVTTEAYVAMKCADGSTHIADPAGEPIANLFGAGTNVGANIFYHRYFQFAGGLTVALSLGYLAGQEAISEIVATE